MKMNIDNIRCYCHDNINETRIFFLKYDKQVARIIMNKSLQENKTMEITSDEIRVWWNTDFGYSTFSAKIKQKHNLTKV